ncbi:E3 ubiquitin-protein ligase TRIM71-like [Montipora foliosa]|uniref:E3 ubiquitin-protein ligase TRIM71-like n=1 Tax=Montipora foliosa TaxID=591990 RepID=UPI0035F1CD39
MDMEKLLHNLQEHVSCPVCQDVFKDPRHLPCLHSFCLNCLTNWHRARGGQNTLRCPKCQGDSSVPTSGDLKDLPISFFVNGLIDALKIKECSKAQVTCGNCHKKSSEALYCFQCGIFYCEQCLIAHNVMQLYSKDHRVVAVKEFKDKDYEELLKRPVFCPREEHEREELKFFCQNCDDTVCQTCFILHHSGHKVRLTKEEAEAQIIDIRPLVQKQNGNLQEKMNIVTQLDEDYARIVQQRENVEQDVERFSENLIGTFRETIQAKKEIILSELKKETKKLLETVITKRTAVQAEIKAIESALEKADKLLTRSTSVEVVQLGKALKKTLEEIDQSEPVARDPGVGLFDLVFVENHRILDAVNNEKIGFLKSCRETKASESVAECKGLNEGTVGREAQFCITTRNSFGERCYNKQDNVAVEMTDERGETCVANFNVNDNKDGTYKISYLPKVEGKFNLSVKVNREHVCGSPFMIVVKSFNVKPILSFGARGSGDGMFDFPLGVAVNSRDEIAVTSKHKIQIFNSEGNFVRSFGRNGSNPGEFNDPYGIAFDKDGNVSVADRSNHRIQIFTGEGRYISMFGGAGHLDNQLQYPWGLSLDSNGNIIIADSSNKFIKIFSHDGKFLKKIGGPEFLNFPVHCVEWHDDLIVSDKNDHCIKVFTKEGDYKYQFGQRGSGHGEFNGPGFLSVTKSGHVIVCERENHRVQVFELPNGKFVGKFGTKGNNVGQLNSPFSVAILRGGQIVVADRENNRIQIFD